MKTAIALLFSAFLIIPAFADEPPRKINFAKVLTGPDGPFKAPSRSN